MSGICERYDIHKKVLTTQSEKMYNKLLVNANFSLNGDLIMKKLAILLCFTLLLGVIPLNAGAVDIDDYKTLIVKEINGTTITGMASGTIDTIVFNPSVQTLYDEEGNPVEWTSVKREDVISVAADGSGNFTYAKLSRTVIFGTITGMTNHVGDYRYHIKEQSSSVEEEGEWYAVACSIDAGIGSEGEFLLDAFGRIAFFNAFSLRNVAYVLGVTKEDGGFDPQVQLRLMNCDGDIKNVNVAPTLKFDDIDLADYPIKDKFITFNFSDEDNRITHINIIGDASDDAEDKFNFKGTDVAYTRESNSLNFSGTTVPLLKYALIFAIPDGDYYDNEIGFAVLSIDDLKADVSFTHAAAYNTNNNTEASCIVVKGLPLTHTVNKLENANVTLDVSTDSAIAEVVFEKDSSGILPIMLLAHYRGGKLVSLTHASTEEVASGYCKGLVVMSDIKFYPYDTVKVMFVDRFNNILPAAPAKERNDIRSPYLFEGYMYITATMSYSGYKEFAGATSNGKVVSYELADTVTFNGVPKNINEISATRDDFIWFKVNGRGDISEIRSLEPEFLSGRESEYSYDSSAGKFIASEGEEIPIDSNTLIMQIIPASFSSPAKCEVFIMADFHNDFEFFCEDMYVFDCDSITGRAGVVLMVGDVVKTSRPAVLKRSAVNVNSSGLRVSSLALLYDTAANDNDPITIQTTEEVGVVEISEAAVILPSLNLRDNMISYQELAAVNFSGAVTVTNAVLPHGYSIVKGAVKSRFISEITVEVDGEGTKKYTIPAAADKICYRPYAGMGRRVIAVDSLNEIFYSENSYSGSKLYDDLDHYEISSITAVLVFKNDTLETAMFYLKR